MLGPVRQKLYFCWSIGHISHKKIKKQGRKHTIDQRTLYYIIKKGAI